jgi:hypothetical protein
MFGGPQLGINVRAKGTNFKYSLGYPPFETKTVSRNIKDDMSPCDLSFSMGAGYTFDMGLIVSVNYNLGCTYIFKESEYTLGGSNLFRGKDHTLSSLTSDGVSDFGLLETTDEKCRN